MDTAKVESLLAESPASLCWFRAQKTNKAYWSSWSLWRSSCGRLTHLSPAEFITAVKLRPCLNISADISPNHPCVCSLAPNRRDVYADSPVDSLHCLSCDRMGGHISIRHNRLRDLIATFVRQYSPTSSAEREAVISLGREQHKCDIKITFASGQPFYLDVTVFNPACVSLLKHSPSELMTKKVAEKRDQYKHVGILPSSPFFVPVVFDATGNLCREAISFFKTHFSYSAFLVLSTSA